MLVGFPGGTVCSSEWTCLSVFRPAFVPRAWAVEKGHGRSASLNASILEYQTQTTVTVEHIVRSGWHTLAQTCSVFCLAWETGTGHTGSSPDLHFQSYTNQFPFLSSLSLGLKKTWRFCCFTRKPAKALTTTLVSIHGRDYLFKFLSFFCYVQPCGMFTRQVSSRSHLRNISNKQFFFFTFSFLLKRKRIITSLTKHWTRDSFHKRLHTENLVTATISCPTSQNHRAVLLDPRTLPGFRFVLVSHSHTSCFNIHVLLPPSLIFCPKFQHIPLSFFRNSLSIWFPVLACFFFLPFCVISCSLVMSCFVLSSVLVFYLWSSFAFHHSVTSYTSRSCF